jgi:hypothetical protein
MTRVVRLAGVFLAASMPGLVSPASAVAQAYTRDQWIALANCGFSVPAGRRAEDLLVEMNTLLASPDPVLRDEVAYAAAERWILRDRVVDADGVKRLVALWTANLDGRTDATLYVGPTTQVIFATPPSGTYFVRVRAGKVVGGGRPSSEIRVDVP